MEPLTPKNQMSFQRIFKPGCISAYSVSASPFKSATPDAGNKQNEIRPHLGLHNNPDMFVCPIKPFLSHYGPCEVDEAIVDGCMVRLAEDKGVLIRDRKGNYTWTDFRTLPKDSRTHEGKTIEPIGTIVDAVLGEKANNLNLLLVPRTELTSDTRGSAPKIDACFIEGPHTGPYLENRAIKTPVEVEKYKSLEVRNIVHLQILSACHHVLNEDPRRMWIYDVTFENSMVSVWYFSRSHSVKSIAFDWIKNPRTLIHVLLAFVRATPVQLGIDPTVHIVPRNGKMVSYVYEVPNENGKTLFFKTGHSLVPQRPVCIAGRTTRVWEVTQVTSADGKEEVSGKKVILKDVWLDASDDRSKTEAENMDAIFKAVDDFVEAGLKAEMQCELKASPLLSEPATIARLTMQFINRDPRFQAFDNATKERLRDNLTNKKYRSMFLTKLHAWTGLTSRVVGPDASRTPDLFHPTLRFDEKDLDKIMDKEYMSERGIGSENATNLTLQGPNDQSKAVDDNYRLFAPKQQSRFIYEEVCTTLQNLDTVGDVVDILCQTVDALHVLFAVGWVHRDISSKNIMAFRSGQNQAWTLKLADLEFSRPIVDGNRKPRSDSRTGTPFFMPVEILARKYFFQDHLLATGKITNANLAVSLGVDKTDKAYQPLSRFTKIPIVEGFTLPANADWSNTAQRNQAVNHNFQHDLESVWWILLWIITCRVSWESSVKETAHCFKHDINDFRGRRSAFIEMINAIEESLHDDLKQDFGSLLEDLRAQMHLDYVMRAIVGHLELPESYSSIHALFSTRFREMQATPGPWQNMKLEHRKKGVEDLVESAIPSTSVIPSTVTGKRVREDSEAEPRRSTKIRKQKVKGAD